MANCLTILTHFRTSDRWEKLDRSGMELTELPPEIGKLVQLKRLILGNSTLKWHLIY